MGYNVVAELSHELETLLDLVRRGERDVTTALMDTLFAAADTLERAIDVSVAGQADTLDVHETMAALRTASRSTAATESAAAPIKASKSRRKRGAKAPAAAESTITIAVAQEPNTPMPAVRAYLIVERAKTLGIGGEHCTRRSTRWTLEALRWIHHDRPGGTARRTMRSSGWCAPPGTSPRFA